MKTLTFGLALVAAGLMQAAQPALDTFISHRGESVDAPENTLPAYRTAVERGFGFECDIYLSADKRVFTFHDGTLARTTAGACTKKCAEANWETEISKVDVGGWGKWKGSKFSPTRPALLEEVLELARDGRQIYIEVKPGPEILPAIKEILAKQSRATPKNVLFISFNAESCKALKRLLPAYRVYFLLGSRRGGKKDANGRAPAPWTADEIVAKLRELGADGVDICFDPKVHTAEFVKKVRAAGFEFHVWTVDRLDLSLQAFAAGAQTVTTNCAKRQLDEYESGAVEVKSSSLAVALGLGAKGAATRLVTAHGADLAPAEGTVPLFRVKATRVDDFAKSVNLTANDATTCTCAPTADGVRLTYGGFAEGVVSVTCTVRGVGDAVRWGVTTQLADGWALEETEYPRLLVAPVLGSTGADDRFVFGTAKGGVTHNPGAKGTGWHAYAKMPGSLVAQFATVYDDRAGLYFAAEDGSCHAKFLGGECAKEGVLVTSRRLGFETGVVAQAYEIVTRGFEGTPADPCTWHDAADIYKKWAVRQKWTTQLFKDRADIPAWMRDAPAMVRFGREWLQTPDRIRSWMSGYWKKEFAAAPLVMAYWGWEKHGYWVTPDYFPVVPDDATFARLVADMKKLGGHAFPWPSGYHWTTTYDKKPDGSFAWDDRARFAQVAEPHAVYNRDGKRYVRVPSWLRGGDCACMCGGDPWTRNWWNRDICLPLAKLGCEMIQVDQVVGGAFPSCWCRKHPHAPGDGLWKTEVFLDQLVTMRETMRTAEKDSIVCVEEPCEFYNHLVGIQDYRDCECGADEWASVFNYIYHEYLPCFQSNPRRGNRVWQAHEAADGQIPFLSPAEADLGGEHAALLNGDFEVRAEGRFRGWEQLSGYGGVAWNGRMFVDAETRHDGAAAIRLEVKKGENAVQVSQNVRVDDAAFLRPGARFRLSAWLKTEHTSQPNSVNFCFLGSRGPGGSLMFPKPEEGWKRVSQEFRVPAGADHLRIMMHLNGDARAWVDSMTLEEIGPDGSAKEVVLSGRGAYDDFMRRWVALYHGEGRGWLAHGRQVKPPRVVCGMRPMEMSLYGGRKFTVQRPNVFCNAFVDAQGRRAVVLANATGEEQAATLYEKGEKRSLRLAADEIRILR